MDTPLPETNDLPTLHSPLSAILKHEPATVPPDATVMRALEIMAERKISSVVVVDPQTGKPLGIFTLRDLLTRVALKGCDRDKQVSEAMTGGNLITLRGESTAYQAALAMARYALHHVPVIDNDGRLIGVVSQGDLFALERSGVGEITNDIRRAGDMDALRHAAREIRRLADNMVEQGVGAERLTHFVSSLNDLLTIRIIELAQAEHKLPDVPWCWVAFGSEGRFEQTFSTDQDNGIIFEAPEADAEAVRQALLPFALDINRRLDACGFDLCKGNIMASNPECCLSVEEWQGRFGSWLRAAQPPALLNATIFFDFRPLYGEERLAETLRSWLLARTAEAPLFLRFMAENALKSDPPLGVIRDFVFDVNPDFPRTLDLKALGTRPFVEAARIFALANGVSQTGTAERLRVVAEKMKFGRDDVHAVVDGFFFIQLLRLRHQRAGVPEGAANRIDPDKLNELDRLILKEAFKQARKLQGRLRMDYRL